MKDIKDVQLSTLDRIHCRVVARNVHARVKGRHTRISNILDAHSQGNLY